MRATGFAVNRITINQNSSGQPHKDSVAFGLGGIVALAVNRIRTACLCVAVHVCACLCMSVLPLDGKAASDGFEAEGGWCVQGAVAPEARESCRGSKLCLSGSGCELEWVPAAWGGAAFCEFLNF